MSTSGIERVPAVLRAMALFEHLAEHGPANASEAARALGFPRTGALRILTTLTALGYLRQDAASGRYELTTRLYHIGAGARRLDIARLARPHLEALRDASGETAELAVREGDELLVVDALDSPQSIRLHARPGSRYPLYRLALGRMILSRLPENDLRRLHKAKRLEQGGYTVPARFAELQHYLQGLARQGYALDEGHAREDVERIAAPVFGPDGQVAAALGIAGPVFRLRADDQRIDLVREAALRLSNELGYTGNPMPIAKEAAS